jgi:imidazolonepropionase-like amidohydrolase
MNTLPRLRFVCSLLFTGIFVSLASGASPATTTPVEGLRDASARVHALTNARVVTAPGQVLDRATIIIRDGVIQAVGSEIAVPADARVWEMAGRTIYSGFIESDSTLFLPAAWRSAAAARRAGEDDDAQQTTPSAGAATATPSTAEVPAGAKAWNPRVTPERRASRALTADPRGADALRKLGFTVAHTVPARGSFRGQSAAVSLGRGGFNRTLLRDSVTQPLAFERGGRRGGEGAAPSESDASYPTSLMGAVALARQTLLDAQWYADAQRRYQERGVNKIDRPETNDALAALGAVVRGEQPVLIPLEDELDTQRAVRLADEFKLKLVLRASGHDYRALRALPATRVPMIVPLAFPEPPDVEHADRALDISLDKLQHWELAPSNPARLAEAGVPIALTTSGLRRPETEFWTRVRQAVQRGLPADKALGALTTVPADLLGLAGTHGTIATGKAANLVVTSGDLFAGEDGEILVVWVDGEPFEMDAWRRFDVRGTWKVAWEGTTTAPAEIKITGRGATRLRATAGGSEATVRGDGENFSLLAPAKWFGGTEGTARLAAHVEKETLRGTGELPEGTAVRWRAERTAPAEATRTPAEKKPGATIARSDVFPAGAFGRAAIPTQPDAVLVKNATLWTSAPEGTLEGTDMLIERGKIARIGRGLSAPTGATVIDATGRHISPGLIDCHSHMAVSGAVNESSHSVTVEVRIGDALDATDIGLYRALAGGLTTANILHGSANAMGGQNQVIKLRWGEQSDGLKFAGAPPGVKFALGENVTRKNSTTGSTRYPVSRMGVREIMLDTFTRARDYEREWTEFRAHG